MNKCKGRKFDWYISYKTLAGNNKAQKFTSQYLLDMDIWANSIKITKVQWHHEPAKTTETKQNYERGQNIIL